MATRPGQRRRTIHLWPIGVLVLVLLSSCSQADRVAVVFREDRTLHFVFQRCPGERIDRIDVLKEVGTQTETVWLAFSDDGTELDEVVLGVPPTGFSESVAFAGLPTLDSTFVVGIEGSKRARGITFRTGQLLPGKALFEDRLMDPPAALAELQRLQGAWCSDGFIGWLTRSATRGLIVAIGIPLTLLGVIALVIYLIGRSAPPQRSSRGPLP